MWSTVAMSSAMWMGWARGKSTTARPMRMRWVRAAMALAIVMGEDKTLIGEKWYSASHTELTPRASAASTNAKHSAKASRSVIPSRYGNSMKSPKSMGVSLLADEARRGGPLADPGKVSLGDLRSRSEEHTSELQSRLHLVCRLLLEKKKTRSHRKRRRRAA